MTRRSGAGRRSRWRRGSGAGSIADTRSSATTACAACTTRGSKRVPAAFSSSTSASACESWGPPLAVRALVPAAAALARDGVELVVAGGHRPQFSAEAGLDGLTLLGHVPEEALPGLYAGAEAFVLPSLYEGFGLPVLEAMASGTPVVAADTSALPDTAGGAARLVEPDPEALREALTTLLGDHDERARLRTLGLERARPFTWERTAREVDAIVRRWP